MEKIKENCEECGCEIFYPKNVHSKVKNNSGRFICKKCYGREYQKKERERNILDRKYIRECSKCKNEIIYARKNSYIDAIKNDSLCNKCFFTNDLKKERSEKYKGDGNPFFKKEHTKEAKEIISNKLLGVKTGKNNKKSLKGENNPMYGRNFYDVWVEKYGIEIADIKMNELSVKRSKNAIGEKNSMYGKPSPVGSGNGWSGWYKGWYFRSLHELSYMVNVIERFNLKWISVETKEYEITYNDYKGTKRTYYADFLIEDKYLIECKPKNLWHSLGVVLKKEAAIIKCKDWNFKYKMVAPIILSDDEILDLYNSGKIKFLDRYEQKFKKRNRI